jgi:hypothetical protein
MGFPQTSPFPSDTTSVLEQMWELGVANLLEGKGEVLPSSNFSPCQADNE